MRRCDHGVYWPEGTPFAWGCQTCNPELLHPTVQSAAPVLPRSVNLSTDLDINRCPKCKNPLLSSFGTANVMRCLNCNENFVVDSKNPSGRANTKQAGTCGECGSSVHTRAGSKWKCADCGHAFTPPRAALLEEANDQES